MATKDIWTYRRGVVATNTLGYEVEALDGAIGKVDDATDVVGASFIIVDTGPWIFGKKVMLPASVVERVDGAEEKVFVSRTKDAIKNAPEFDETRYTDDAYRNKLGRYYGPGGAGYRVYQ